LADELSSVCRQAFEVTALAFGVERVEREGALAAPADPGEAYKLIPGEFEIDILQVMFAGAPNNDWQVG
jgi:hypothetical protein